jgi:hypothetical protein
MAETGSAGATMHRVPTPDGMIHVAEHAGEGPALVLMHGFPDDARICDRLVPLLAPRRVASSTSHPAGLSGTNQTTLPR